MIKTKQYISYDRKIAISQEITFNSQSRHPSQFFITNRAGKTLFTSKLYDDYSPSLFLSLVNDFNDLNEHLPLIEVTSIQSMGRIPLCSSFITTDGELSRQYKPIKFSINQFVTAFKTDNVLHVTIQETGKLKILKPEKILAIVEF